MKAYFSLTAKSRSVIVETMKVETTIAIEADLLEQVENAATDFRGRSEVFEKALREYLPKLNKKPAKRKKLILGMLVMF